MREAVREDARAIAEVHVGSWRASYKGMIDDEILAELDVDRRAAAWDELLDAADHRTWVVEDGGRIAGFISARPSGDGDVDRERVGEIPMLYLHPDAWGKGAGRVLIETAESHMAASFDQVTLWVLERNERARRFYELAGYRDDDGRKDCFGGVSAPAVRYRKSLASTMPE